LRKGWKNYGLELVLGLIGFQEFALGLRLGRSGLGLVVAIGRSGLLTTVNESYPNTHWTKNSVTYAIYLRIQNNVRRHSYSNQYNIHRVSEKKHPLIIIGYKLRNSCLILIMFDTKKNSRNLTSHDSLVVHLT